MVVLPGKWVDTENLDAALLKAGDPHNRDFSEVQFVFQPKCKMMLDASVQLLSLITQLDSVGKVVRLQFKDGPSGTMGYLDRMGFFNYVSKTVKCDPYRPLVSGADIFAGYSDNLLEIQPITPEHRDEELPGRLASILEGATLTRPDHKSLRSAAFTVFAELIDNVFEHSATQLDGFAALQVYRNSGKAQVAVSDSGRGILNTLRPELPAKYQALTDVKLLVEMFREGLSRHGSSRGSGLKQSAAKAIKYQAVLNVRLPTSRVRLVPSSDGYTPNTAICTKNLPLMWGTHIAFEFKLDQ